MSFDKDEGIHYTFKQCPIANFAKEHQLLEIMPAICNSDYPAIGLLHAGLIRKALVPMVKNVIIGSLI